MVHAAASRELTVVEAVRAGDAATARALIARNADVNVPESDGTTALHWAAEHDDLELAGALIRAGARAQAANRYGVTPLHLAAEKGSAGIVGMLLAAGADPNAPLPSGETALMTAAATGIPAAIEALLDGGADVTAKERVKGQTAMMWAAAANNAAALRLLHRRGGDIRATSEGGFTPLLFAVRGGHIAAVEALLELGADVNESLPDQMSALVLAVYNAHYELAATLLEHGADPNAAAQGWSALHQVAWSRRPNRGFNLPGAVPTGSLDSLELVRRLVARGADVDARLTKEPRDGNRNMLNRLGATPLLMAAKSADVPLMQLLLDSGADPSLTTNDGTTMLMVAAGVGVYGPGESPGTHEEALEAVKLAHAVGGGDVNASNLDGETALHGAVYRGGAVPVIEFLVAQGARMDVENRKKWTPLFAAEGVVYASSGIRRYPEAAQLLRRLMLDRGIAADEAGRIKGVAPEPAAVAAAPGERTNWDGVFTAEQSQRGRQVYQRACSACHLDSLEGDAVSPPLKGESFSNRYIGASAEEMVTAIRSSMPQNAPDSLGDRAYVDLISFLLETNGSTPGSTELPTDVRELGKIRITAAPAAR